MLDKMSEIGIKNPEKTITVDIDQINSIVVNSKQEVDKVDLRGSGVFIPQNKQKKTFVSWIKGFFKNV